VDGCSCSTPAALQRLSVYLRVAESTLSSRLKTGPSNDSQWVYLNALQLSAFIAARHTTRKWTSNQRILNVIIYALSGIQAVLVRFVSYCVILSRIVLHNTFLSQNLTEVTLDRDAIQPFHVTLTVLSIVLRFIFFMALLLFLKCGVNDYHRRHTIARHLVELVSHSPVSRCDCFVIMCPLSTLKHDVCGDNSKGDETHRLVWLPPVLDVSQLQNAHAVCSCGFFIHFPGLGVLICRLCLFLSSMRCGWLSRTLDSATMCGIVSLCIAVVRVSSDPLSFVFRSSLASKSLLRIP
jgi:hypothetical protein